MKKFHEFVVQKEDSAVMAEPEVAEPVIKPKPKGVFSNIGMDKRDVGKTMRSLRNMLSSRGVATGSDEKKAMRRMVSIMRGAIMRLIGMGLSADDLLYIFQAIMGMVVNKGSSQTNMNLSKVNKEINKSIGFGPKSAPSKGFAGYDTLA